MVRMNWSGKPPDEPQPQKVQPPTESPVKVTVDNSETVKIDVKPQKTA